MASSSLEVGHDGCAVDREALGEFLDGGAGLSLLDELVNLWGSQSVLFLQGPATLRGAGVALSIVVRGRNAVIWGFGV